MDLVNEYLSQFVLVISGGIALIILIELMVFGIYKAFTFVKSF